MSLTTGGDNLLQCTAILAERDIRRYTPAGIPILTAKLLHASEQIEAGMVRQVAFEVAAVAAGDLASRLEQATLGAHYRFEGFLARKTRNSKSLVLHLTNFRSIS